MNHCGRARLRRSIAAAVAVATIPLVVGAPSAVSAKVDAPAAVSASVAARNPSYKVWIRRMNNKADMSGSQFIATYGSPNHFDWSTDGCSNPFPDSKYGFTWACRRHDFGYRNLKRAQSIYNRNTWRWHNKAAADYQFLEDMATHCANNWSGAEREDCYDDAELYYDVVCLVGDFEPTCGAVKKTYLR